MSAIERVQFSCSSFAPGSRVCRKPTSASALGNWGKSCRSEAGTTLTGAPGFGAAVLGASPATRATSARVAGRTEGLSAGGAALTERSSVGFRALPESTSRWALPIASASTHGGRANHATRPQRDPKTALSAMLRLDFAERSGRPRRDFAGEGSRVEIADRRGPRIERLQAGEQYVGSIPRRGLGRQVQRSEGGVPRDGLE